MLQLRPNSTGSNGQAAAYAQRQRRRMWLAMILLVGALGVVLIKDHQLWFNSDEVADDESAGSTSKETAKKPASVHRQGERSEKHVSAATSEITASEPGTSIIETARAAVRPLDVQVVSSNQARVVRGSNNTLQVEIPAYSGMWTTKWASTPSGTNLVATTNAVQRVLMASEGGDVPQDSSSASYPLLSKQMRVRGAVVLEAIVGADGNIEDLRVLSGPTVLASAAREALRQWKFKPYLQNGRPVESQAKITVNFLISAS
jgi:TonB family protein